MSAPWLQLFHLYFVFSDETLQEGNAGLAARKL